MEKYYDSIHIFRKIVGFFHITVEYFRFNFGLINQIFQFDYQ